MTTVLHLLGKKSIPVPHTFHHNNIRVARITRAGRAKATKNKTHPGGVELE